MSFIYSLTATWNNVATTYNAIQMDVSDGAGGAPIGAAASRILNLKNNGTTVFSVDKNGNVAATNVWVNTRSAHSANYTVQNSDKAKTLALAGNTKFTLSFLAESNYDTDFMVTVVNEDFGRGKLIVLNGTGVASFILWPRQTATIFVTNAVWAFVKPTLWSLPSTGTTQFYIDASNGNDTTNDGLAAGAGNACQTLFSIVTVVQSNWLLAPNTSPQVQANVAAGVYTTGLHLAGPFICNSGNAAIRIVGDATTPTNVTVSTVGTGCIETFQHAVVEIQGLYLTCAGAGTNCLLADSGSDIRVLGAIIFGPGAATHMYSRNQGQIFIDGSYSISGDSPYHAYASDMGTILFNTNGSVVVTLLANIACSSDFVGADRLALQRWGSATISLGAFGVTGQRYLSRTNSVIDTFGGGANYFPGSIAGAVATGGQYT